MVSAGTGTTYRSLRSQPKFHPSFWARRKLNLLIKSQYIHKMRFQHQNHRSQTPCQYRPSYHTLLPHGHLCQEQKRSRFLVSRQPFHYFIVLRNSPFAANQSFFNHRMLFEALKTSKTILTKTRGVPHPQFVSSSQNSSIFILKNLISKILT